MKNFIFGKVTGCVCNFQSRSLRCFPNKEFCENCFLLVSFLCKNFWEQDSATLLKTKLLQRSFSRILTENSPKQLSKQLFMGTSFFPGHLCGCFQTLFRSTRLLFFVFLISPVCCFVVFTPIIKFNFHNG